MMATSTMTEAQLNDAIAARRRGLADVLSELAAGSWDADTLCEGWRVRELVAHMTMPFRYSAVRFVVEMGKSGGRFSHMADRCARRDAAMPTAELVSGLRDNATYVWKPPGGGLEAGLIHDAVHGLDFTVPLGISQPIPEEVLRTVLDEMAKPSSLKHFGVDPAGSPCRPRTSSGRPGRGRRSPDGRKTWFWPCRAATFQPVGCGAARPRSAADPSVARPFTCLDLSSCDGRRCCGLRKRG